MHIKFLHPYLKIVWMKFVEVI